jgi:hypothetical protein
LPEGTDTFNFSNTAYNYSIVSQSNSIFTATNTTVTAKQWEWIYFNAVVKQTGIALANYSARVSSSLINQSFANKNNPIRLSLQYLYPSSSVKISKTGYQNTTEHFTFTLSAANTYTIYVNQAAISIYINHLSTNTPFKNGTVTVFNATKSVTFTNVSLPLYKTFNEIPLGNDTIRVQTNSSYTSSFYYFYMTPETVLNLTTYVTKTANSVTLTFQVSNTYYALVQNAVVYLETSVGGSQNIVMECQTLASGQCQINTYDGMQYTYYAELPFTDLQSVLYPLDPLQSGSGGSSCSAGVWCAVLQVQVVNNPLSNFFKFTSDYSPQISFLNSNTTYPFMVNFTAFGNDMNEVVDNISVVNQTSYYNSTVLSWKVYTFDKNPSSGSLAFNYTTPLVTSQNSEVMIIENVSYIMPNQTTTIEYKYYVSPLTSSPSTVNCATNPTASIGCSLSDFSYGLGPVGFTVVFWMIAIAVSILIWVMSQSQLMTMLILDALSGVFAYFGAFSLNIGPLGTAFGWVMFAVFVLFTILLQFTKIGGY